MTVQVVPQSEAELTVHWFTDVLSGRFPGVEVAAAEATTRIGGTATKIRYALSYATEPPPHIPRSVWVKSGFDASGADQGEAFANEARFFVEIAPQIQANQPDCYFGAVDPETGGGIVVLEDLLSRGARFEVPADGLGVDGVARVLSLQARYHAAFWMADALAVDYPWLRPGGAIAETNMVDQFFGFWDSAVERERFALVPPGQRDRDRMHAALRRLTEYLRRESICLVHGDAHQANLFFDAEGEPGYLDWQHVMRASWAFDVISIVVPSLEPVDRAAHERELLDHYRAELTRYGVEPPALGEMWESYRKYAAWCYMWVLLPEGYHPEELCRTNTVRATAVIDDLGSVAALAASD